MLIESAINSSAVVIYTMRIFSIFGITLAFLLTGQAKADALFNLELLGKNFSYTEYATDGDILNRETGYLPGIGLDLSRTSGNTTIGLHGHAYSDRVDYDGQTQAGDPHTTQTNTGFYEIGLFTSIQIIPKKHLLTFGLSQNYWVRDILSKGSVLGLYELYHWNTVRSGYQYQTDLGAHHLNFGIEQLWHINNSMDVDFDGSNSTSIPLKDGFGWQWNVNYSRKLQNQWMVSIGHQWQYWSTERSNSVLVQTKSGPIIIMNREVRLKTESLTSLLVTIINFIILLKGTTE